VTEGYSNKNEIYLISKQSKTRSPLFVGISVFQLLALQLFNVRFRRRTYMFNSFQNQGRNILQLQMSVSCLCKFCRKHC